MLGVNRTFISLILIVCVINLSYGAIASWGENCEFAECIDHRLICKEVTEQNITKKLCVCDWFHKWNETFKDCVLNFTTQEILNQLEEKYNITSKIEYDANVVFFAQLVAGLFVVAVGILCSFVVCIYCIRMEHKDTELQNLVKKLEAQKHANKASTSRPRYEKKIHV